ERAGLVQVALGQVQERRRGVEVDGRDDQGPLPLLGEPRLVLRVRQLLPPGRAVAQGEDDAAAGVVPVDQAWVVGGAADVGVGGATALGEQVQVGERGLLGRGD